MGFCICYVCTHFQHMNKKKQPSSAPLPSAVPSHIGISKMWSKWPLILLAFSLIFILAVRLRLLDVPLERDEGGFAYIGKMMLEGQNLYTDLLDSKLPGLYFLYGIFVKVFGYTPSGVHAGLLLCNLAATVLLFFLLKKRFDASTAAWASLVFAVTSTSFNVLGFAAHATQLLLPLSLGGLLVLVNELPRPQIRAKAVGVAGLLLGAAFLVKQQALFFMPFAALYLWAFLHEHGGGRRSWGAATYLTVWLAAGSILPYLLVFAYMGATGRAEAFWFWTFELPLQLEGSHSRAEKVELFHFMSDMVLKGQWLLWLLAAVSMAAVWFTKLGRSRKVFAFAFPVLMFAAVLAGAAYYPHYWVLVLPALALLAGLAPRLFPDKNGALKIGTVVLAASVVMAIASHSAYYFSDDSISVVRQAYLTNPFPEAKIIGAEIRKRSRPGDQMIIFGAEPELLVAAGLPSATGHIFPYHTVDGQPYNERFQQQMLSDLNKKMPRYVVVYTNGTSWMATDLVHANAFLERLSIPVFQNPAYRRIGVVDIFKNGQIYKWDRELDGFNPSSGAQIWIYEIP